MPEEELCGRTAAEGACLQREESHAVLLRLPIHIQVGEAINLATVKVML
jgi:hypothetical protein